MSSTPATPVPIRIDFVSDVSCPWCVIGLKALEQALAKLDGTVQAEIHFQPFELNANMPAEGEWRAVRHRPGQPAIATMRTGIDFAAGQPLTRS